MKRPEFTKMVEAVLYSVDPANTYCYANDITDEYASEAEMIAEYVFQNNFTVQAAVGGVLDFKFGPGVCDEEKVLMATRIINEKLL